ncbi:MAG: hypothetical protein ACRDAX_01095 [Propionibacteriaceae bacterium]
MALRAAASEGESSASVRGAGAAPWEEGSNSTLVLGSTSNSLILDLLELLEEALRTLSRSNFLT